jgi:DNA-binding response OmpR family regulator
MSDRHLRCTITVAVYTRDLATLEIVRKILEDASTHVRSGQVTLRPKRAVCHSTSSDQTLPDVCVVDAAGDTTPARTLRTLRQRWVTTSIIVINLDARETIARWIALGADDACTHQSTELIPRLHALARRARTLNAETRIAIGDIVLDREHRRAWCQREALLLSPLEYDLLLCLCCHAPHVVERDAIIARVWRDATRLTPNALEVYVGYLRRKLSRSQQLSIVTVRGVGYAIRALPETDTVIATVNPAPTDHLSAEC